MNILLIAQDPEYGKALAQTMTSINPGISVFLRRWEEEKSLEMEAPAPELLLVEMDSPTATEMNFKEKYSCPVLILTGEEGGEEASALYKYENVRWILKRMYQEMGGIHWDGFSSMDGHSMKLIAVCGCRGGCGRTAVSWGLAQELSVFHGAKVLYLNGGEIDGGDFISLTEEIRTGIQHFFYQMEQNRIQDPRDFLCESPYGVWYFHPSGRKNPLRELSEAQGDTLLELLREKGKFDYIIGDLQGLMDPFSRWIIKKSRWTCYLSNGELASLGKENKNDGFALQYLTGELIPENKEAPLLIQNETRPGAYKGEGEIKENICFIEFDPLLITEAEAFPQIPMDGVFGRRIKEITQRLLASEE